MPLKVIGAGFGRTGTLSMKAALERLGYAPCYHFVEIIEPRPGCNDGHARAWVDFMKGRAGMDWERLFARYEAVLDLPMCLFYRELMEAFPDARVILTLRDPERWFESYAGLFRALGRMRLGALFSAKLRTSLSVGRRVNARLGSTRIDRDAWIAAYERHNREVVETVPKERLLVYRVREGWAPLCEFLGRPIPPDDFPHLNEGEDLATRIFQSHILHRKDVFSTEARRPAP